LSVINQMLKDLEQRSGDKPEVNTSAVPVPVAKSSNKKLVITTAAVLTLINIIAFWVWQLYQENQSLKSSQLDSPVVLSANKVEPGSTTAKAPSPISSKSNHQGAEENALIEKNIVPTDKKQTFVDGKDEIANNTPGNSQRQEQKVSAARVNTAQVEPTPAPVKTERLAQKEVSKSSQPALDTLQDKKAPAPVEKSHLAIKRRQLTAEELVQQKMSQAEQAIVNNNAAKAEALFEEVLLLKPEQKEARKQLAALWFGRQAYQGAINLLAQGLALAPNNRDFRLMQARLYLSQGNKEQAYRVLKAMPDTVNSEYQLALANTAQQLGKFDAAIYAYKILVQLQPQNARWWLGLGVAHDSNGQFNRAAQAYQSALGQGGLSESAANFARQRITELGE